MSESKFAQGILDRRDKGASFSVLIALLKGMMIFRLLLLAGCFILYEQTGGTLIYAALLLQLLIVATLRVSGGKLDEAHFT